jgi:asparagine N-glycosylation enzyme membrane subunit Stt3
MQISFFALAAYIIGLIALFALSLLFAERKILWIAFPVISGILFAVLLMASLSLLYRVPGSFSTDTLIQASQYLFGGMGGKVSEAQPLLFSFEILFSEHIFSNLGWTLLFSILGLFTVFYYMSRAEESKKSGLLLFSVLSTSLLIFTLGQIRFIYFFNIIMCILISNLFVQMFVFAENKNWLQGPKKNVISFILLIILVLPFASEIIALSNQNPPIAEDWYETLNWIRSNTNSTSWYDDPSSRPEYSVMSWWDYGNWIIYQGMRPVVANNFQAYMSIQDAGKFFLSNNESSAIEMMDARGSRYVITDYDMLYSKLYALAIWSNEDPSIYLNVKDFGTHVVAEPTEKLLETTLAQLHFRDAAGMGRFRLIYESPNKVGKNNPYNKVKLFEYVPGAMIRIQSEPNQTLGVILNLTSNQRRSFQYFNMGIPTKNGYEIRVPYSTEPRYETHAQNPYLVMLKNSEGFRTRNVDISEKDVLEGRTVRVNF